MNQSKTLILYTYDFPPLSGGISRLCEEIAKGQSKFYKKVIVLTNCENNYSEQRAYSIKKLPKNRFFSDLFALFYFLFKKNKNNYIILTSLCQQAFIPISCGYKNVFSLAHGAELKRGRNRLRNFFILDIFLRMILPKIKLVICNSNYTKSILEKMYPNSNSKVLNLAVDIDFFKPIEVTKKSNKFIIGTVSRIHKFKGYDNLFDILSELDFDIQNKIRWDIAGEGPYKSFFQEKVESKNKLFEVNFLGFINDDELVKFYNENDLFVLLTQENKNNHSVEGFGLVFIESQSCGTPVIGSDTGGISDAIYNNHGGWVFNQNDKSSVKEKITQLINNSDFLHQHSQKARKNIIQNFSWKDYHKNLFSLLKK